MVMTLSGSVMKVGNSTVMIIPKAITENFGIKRGDVVKFLITEKGLYIHLTQKKPKKKKTKKV